MPDNSTEGRVPHGLVHWIAAELQAVRMYAHRAGPDPMCPKRWYVIGQLDLLHRCALQLKEYDLARQVLDAKIRFDGEGGR